MPKIKVLYIMPALDQGGAERFLVDLILNLDKNIYEPTLLLFKRSGLWINELEAINVPVIILSKRFKFDINNFFAIVNSIKKIKPDVVHTQLGADIYGRLAAKFLKVPVIISTEQNLNPDESLLRNLGKRLTAKLEDKTVAISLAVKNDLLLRYKIKEDKIQIISNGININKFSGFSRKMISKEPYKIVIGTMGRLVHQKGQNILIEALSKINDNNFECLIAGSGPLEKKLNEHIEKLGLQQKVKLVGLISDSPKFLNSLDAFIFPSIWEGQGIVLMEAALMNLPIIASDVDGIKEILSDETAYLVEPGNIDALAAKILWLLNNINSELVKSKTIKLHGVIVNQYAITKIAKDYESLYQKMLTLKKR